MIEDVNNELKKFSIKELEIVDDYISAAFRIKGYSGKEIEALYSFRKLCVRTLKERREESKGFSNEDVDVLRKSSNYLRDALNALEEIGEKGYIPPLQPIIAVTPMIALETLRALEELYERKLQESTLIFK